MPIRTCINPECEKAFDVDGFGEHGKPTLFYCECGKIYEMTPSLELREIPREEVDLSGLEGQFPIPKDHYLSENMSRGLFIFKKRWAKCPTSAIGS